MPTTPRRKQPPARAKRDDPEQSKLFIAKARKLGADESSSADADELLGRLAHLPPQPKRKREK